MFAGACSRHVKIQRQIPAGDHGQYSSFMDFKYLDHFLKAELR